MKEYESQSARDAQRTNYGGPSYWDYLDQHAKELRDLRHNDPEGGAVTDNASAGADAPISAPALRDQSLSHSDIERLELAEAISPESLMGNDGP